MSKLAQTQKPALSSSTAKRFRSRSQDAALPVFNYSSQAKNSTLQALSSIKEAMGNKKRYTFCQDFLFGTFDPVSLEEEK